MYCQGSEISPPRSSDWSRTHYQLKGSSLGGVLIYAGLQTPPGSNMTAGLGSSFHTGEESSDKRESPFTGSQSADSHERFMLLEETSFPVFTTQRLYLGPPVSPCLYLWVVQQHLPTVLHGQVGLALPLLPGVLVEGELPGHFRQPPEQRVGVEFILQLLHAVQLLTNKEKQRDHRRPFLVNLLMLFHCKWRRVHELA